MFSELIYRLELQRQLAVSRTRHAASWCPGQTWGLDKCPVVGVSEPTRPGEVSQGSSTAQLQASDLLVDVVKKKSFAQNLVVSSRL